MRESIRLQVVTQEIVVGIARWAVVGLSAVLLVGGCLSTRVSDLEVFDSIPMSRVVPFPDPEELRERGFEVVLIDRESTVSEASEGQDSTKRLRRKLRRLVRDAGASVVALARERRSNSDQEATVEDATEIDFVLGIRVDAYQNSATWKPPFKFLWQTPEEVAGREGTCTHRADIAFEIEVLEAANTQHRVALYRLEHASELESKELDKGCPLDPRARQALFEETLDDSLSCLRHPLEELLAPRGHIRAHRVHSDTGQHLYQISLGSQQGMQPGRKLDIRREQHASTPTGESSRTERVISSGVVTDQVAELDAWIAVDPTKDPDEILEGDLVRPIVSEGLLSSLSGPDCTKILEQR